MLRKGQPGASGLRYRETKYDDGPPLSFAKSDVPAQLVRLKNEKPL